MNFSDTWTVVLRLEAQQNQALMTVQLALTVLVIPLSKKTAILLELMSSMRLL